MWPWLPERVVVVHIPCVLSPQAAAGSRPGERPVRMNAYVRPLCLKLGGAFLRENIRRWSVIRSD